jgi:protein-disulfide isomerase
MTQKKLTLKLLTKTVNQHFLTILVGLVVLGVVFFAGSLWRENKLLKTGQLGTTPSTVKTGNSPEPVTKGVASVDDDPVLGDANAPITIIEFSDYECPFCKRHFDQTLPQLMTEYVNTGEVKIVYRDLPLSFHEPMATKEAVAANCAREQGGDSKYFEYHDEIFTRTVSNGNGLAEADLTTIATDLGLNLSSFNSCLLDPAQVDEVKKDVADAGRAGATGTPTFVIGKSTSNGEINGDLVVGAQPFAAFQAVIDPLLQ